MCRNLGVSGACEGIRITVRDMFHKREHAYVARGIVIEIFSWSYNFDLLKLLVSLVFLVPAVPYITILKGKYSKKNTVYQTHTL
jgi:hypothetical protein